MSLPATHSLNRVKSLDYLRGLMACSIMIYHYTGWMAGPVQPASLLGKLGIYGVSTFYILSGLTLYLVYSKKIIDLPSAVPFLIKRIFRIFPLLWVATIMTLIVRREVPEFYTLFLNLTGLFGFIDPVNYIGTGVWSIGNELVFYAFFPVFMILLNRRYHSVLWLLFAVSALAGIYFAYALPEGKWWNGYVNPLNQLYLFAGGIATGMLLKKSSGSMHYSILLLCMSVVIFITLPVGNSEYSLVTGINRLLLSAMCLAVVALVYSMDFTGQGFVYRFLGMLGECSYSIYLLHPVIYNILKGFSLKITAVPSWLLFSSSVMITIGASMLMYRYLEQPMIRIGSRLAGKKRLAAIS